MLTVFFPIASFFLLLFIFYSCNSTDDLTSDWRKAFLQASLALSTFLVFSTEILSLFSLFELNLLTWLWGGFFLCLALWSLWKIRLSKKIIIPSFNLDRFCLIMVIFMVLIMGVLAGIAWIAPPNNYDSMTYHMSRVMHWIQNETIAPYPTSNSRQIWQNPFAEYTIAQLQIFLGGDRLANFVQWFSMVASVLGSSLIARQLGANKLGQLSASVFTLTLPMGILQSTSTQNDYVFSWWMVCFVYLTIQFIQKPTVVNSFWIGLSLGLAMLTKAIAYPFAAPYVIFLTLFILIRYTRKSVSFFAPIVILVFLLNAGFTVRNFLSFGSLIGTGNFSRYSNEVLSLPAVTSNIVRNIGLHTWTPLASINQINSQIVEFIHQNILFIAVNDPRTTGYGFTYPLAKNPTNEDYAGNPVHFLLILGAILGFLVNKPIRSSRLLVWYSGMLVFAFLFFCAYLKWQPWASRLHLALFVLWSPFIAVVLNHIRHPKAEKLIPSLLLIFAVPWIMMNSAKPLLPRPQSILTMERSSMIFFDRPELYRPYQNAVSFIRNNNSTRTGLLIGGDDWEYPLWALANEGMSGIYYSFEHILLEDDNSDHALYSAPTYIITTDINRYPNLTFGGKEYVMVWSEAPLGILAAQNPIY